MVHIIFISALFFTIPDLNKKYPSYIFTFIILFLFLALRNEYGNDYMSYYEIHNSINKGISIWGENDVFFKYLNLAIPNFYLYIAIIGLFYIITIVYLIRNNSKVKDYWFNILLLLINPYLFLIHLSSIRQTIAICIFIISINFIINKNIVKYFLCILIATGFHKSAIILLPIYFIINDKKIKMKWIIAIYLIILLLLSTPLLDVILNKAFEYFPQYIYYYEQGLQNSLRATLISSFYFFLVIFNVNKLEGRQLLYGKLSLISTIISLIAFKVSMITRVGMYFDIFTIITIPQIFLNIKVKANRQVLFITLILIYILRYVSFFSNPIWKEAYSIYRTILIH